MKPDERHLATSYLWLYAAGCDPTELDSAGTTLAHSLANLLAKVERDGRREAAACYLQTTQSGEHALGDTGSYEVGQLQELLDVAAGED